MFHETLGRLHAELAWRLSQGQRGQGTVEYVALMLLVAAVLATVISVASGKGGGIADAVVNKFKGTIDGMAAKGAAPAGK